MSAATNCRYFFIRVVWSTTVGLGVGTKDMVAAGTDRIALNKGRLMSALVSEENHVICRRVTIMGTSILVSALHNHVQYCIRWHYHGILTDAVVLNHYYYHISWFLHDIKSQNACYLNTHTHTHTHTHTLLFDTASKQLVYITTDWQLYTYDEYF